MRDVISRGLLGLAACLISLASAQATWQANQINTTMCYWEQLRAAVVRDTLYLDGGYLWWQPGLSDGTYGAVTSDYNPLGLVYTLNFSKSFETSQNITAILGTISKAGGGGAANNLAPTYYDGAMLANNDEWFLYGGLLRDTAAYSEPHSDDVTSYQAFQYGVQKDGFQPGFVSDRLPPNMTRYLAYGGAANAPSENKAWYFSGMHSPSWGEIYTPSLNESATAINVSSTLITLDMGTQQQESWRNDTLPASIPGRANPELVWVPIGSAGILIALGGVVYPEFVSSSHVSSNIAASQQDSPTFMSNIDIYDVASGSWYQQSTSGGPGALTRGCAVVAPAQDTSSFNIYYYGGYDGLHATQSFNDDVWVLSIPSFTWTKVATGTASHGRAGHKCFMPYPDQMMVVGGYTALTGASPACVQGGIIQIFNLTSATWMSKYDPAQWGKYGVPDAVRSKIGGSATGGATMMTPSPSGWSSPDLQRALANTYPTSKLTSYYPYSSMGPNNNTNPGYSGGGGSGTPAFLAPLLGTLIGLMVVILIGMLIFCWRRRQRRQTSKSTASDAGTESTSTRRRVMAWMRGQPYTPSKEGTISGEGTSPFTPDMESLSRTHSSSSRPMHHEMADNHIAELADTSSRVELGDTSLAPPKPPYAHNPYTFSSPSNPSSTGSLNDTQHYNGVSRFDHANDRSAPVVPAEIRPDHDPEMLDPPSMVHLPGPGHLSGVSAISDRDRTHLRTISEATVSSFGGGDGRGDDIVSPATATREGGYHWPVSPVSATIDPSVERRLTSGSNGTFGESPLRRAVNGDGDSE